MRVVWFVSIGSLSSLLACSPAMPEGEQEEGDLVEAEVAQATQAVYSPPADNGFGVPPPTLASRAAGATPDGSNNDVGYCHGGHCISWVGGGYYNARKIRFNRTLINWRNDPNLHQVLARAFHPYYVTKDENFSSNDCLGGWRLCSPPAVYDMEVRKIASCSGMPADCIVNAWTFQMLHAYLWANQVAGSADHCGDAEGNIVVIRVDPADPYTAYVWYVRARDDGYAVHPSNLDFTGAHPQFVNGRDGCGISGCSGSHHKQYARRTNDGDAHGYTVDNTLVFFHPGLEYDYKRNINPSLTCEMPYHGYRCNGGSLNEGHDNDNARCGRSGYSGTLVLTTSVAGSGGPWGASTSGAGAFYGGYLSYCPLTSDSASGWGIGLNASWAFGDSGARWGHPKGVVENAVNSCAGNCGGYGNGCWCDAQCTFYGDCCADACSTCGQCP